MKTLALLLILFPSTLLAQFDPAIDPNLSSEEKEVMAVIIELFDGYRAADSSRVRAVFTKDAVLQRAGTKEGKPVLTPSNSINGFVKYVGSGLKQVHDEPLWDYKVNIDGSLASVWTKYAFYLDKSFHHCGAENFLLFNDGNGWKIFHLVDTSQTEGCDIPAEISESRK